MCGCQRVTHTLLRPPQACSHSPLHTPVQYVSPAPRRGRSRRRPISLQTQGLLNSQPGLCPGGWTPFSPALLQSSEMLQRNLARAPATSSLSPWSGRSQNEPLNCLVLFFKENHVSTLMPKLQRLTARQLRLAEPAAAELLSPGPFYVSGATGGGCFKERSAERGFAAGHPEAPSLRSGRHRGSLLQSPTPVCFWLELEPCRAQLMGTLPAAVASAPCRPCL